MHSVVVTSYLLAGFGWWLLKRHNLVSQKVFILLLLILDITIHFRFLMWLHWILAAACRIFSYGVPTPQCSMWDLVP